MEEEKAGAPDKARATETEPLAQQKREHYWLFVVGLGGTQGCPKAAWDKTAGRSRKRPEYYYCVARRSESEWQRRTRQETAIERYNQKTLFWPKTKGEIDPLEVHSQQ